MYEVIYRLLEMAALVQCLHSLSGEKVRLDIYNTGFVAIELVFMQLIQDKIVSDRMYFVVYLIYFVYAYVKFNFTIKQTVFRCLLAVLITGCLQMIIYIPASFLNYLIPSETIIILTINLCVFMIVFWTRNSDKYRNVATFFVSKDWILKICLLACIAIVIFCMFFLKQSDIIKTDLFVLVSVFMIMFSVFLYRWQRSTYELERKEREIEIINLYNGVFEDLIKTIRNRQHDFNNQIEAIYSSHLTAKSLDELIQLQKEYCDDVVYENRYSKVLGCVNNSALSGFLYTKFFKAEQCGIKVEYDIEYTGNTSISLYDLIEIIGIFMDNAMEALYTEQTSKKIQFQLKDYGGINLCIKNPVNNISNSEIEKFFERGFSTKGKDRGIGLNKIKELQKKYQYDIYVHIFEDEGEQWIEFQVIENK